MSELIESQEVNVAADSHVLQRAAMALLDHATFGAALHAQMVVSADNVRAEPGEIAELCALIRSQGVLQNLICFEQKRDGVPTGRFEVAAGRRRWTAVGLLIAEGSLPEDFRIPFLLATEEEAVLVSLAENHGRAPMHPADVCRGMLVLAQRGHSVGDIAVSFGLDPLTVRQRLKLANVAPRLFALFREGKATYEQMAALAVTDDHAAQQAAWDGLDAWSRQPHQLRRLLTAQRIPVHSDRVARYVGVKAFEAAGGKVERDLFSQRDEGYIDDVALLESLAQAKLQRVGQRLRRERWAWVEVRARIDAAELALYGRVRTAVIPPNAEQAAALAQLDERAARLNASAEADDDAPSGDAADVDLDATVQELAEIDIERGRIRRALCQPDPADRELAGALVTLDEDGKPCVQRGLIRPQDKSRMAKSSEDNAGTAKSRAKPVHSERLTLLLSAQRTLALRAELVRQPEVAVLVLAHRLIASAFYSSGRIASAVQLEVRPPVLPDEAHSGSAWEYWEAQRAELAAQLPQEPGGAALMEWLRRQPRQVVDAYIAFCTACMVNGLQANERPLPAVDALAHEVSLDMHAWWKPTVQGYFAHVNKGRMMEVVAQAASPATAVPLEKMRKDAAAEAAARALADSDWLPPLFCGTPAN
ncbi:ParB/RepB/Spo0J family partition protein [Duganella hordei]|uniref:ParB/RepB/Spo0J family partition protein n=1 Tax=Duganella hordei TaxID=2865934 RepID=UPI0030E76BB2